MIGNGFGGGKLADASTITGAGSGTLQLHKGNGNSYIMGNTITGGVNVQVRTGDIRLTQASDYTGVTTVDSGATLTINGAIVSATTINDGLLGGAGTVGAVSFGALGGKLAPGNILTGYGTLDTGDIDLSSAGTVSLELAFKGLVGGTDYDRLRTVGLVNLAGQNLNLSLDSGYTPDVGDVFSIILNDDIDAILGTFGGLGEGASFTSDSTDFSISYVGGDGNDVVVTVIPEPATLGLVIAFGGGLVFVRRKFMI